MSNDRREQAAILREHAGRLPANVALVESLEAGAQALDAGGWQHERKEEEKDHGASLPNVRDVLDALPLEAIRSAAGLCSSEGRKWEHAHPKTGSHWESVSVQLNAIDLCITAWREQIGSGNEAAKEHAVPTGRSAAKESNSQSTSPAPPGDHP